MKTFDIGNNATLTVSTDTAAQWIERLIADAERYRFLRDCDGGPPNMEAAELWEWLICKGCTGDEFDRTVDKLKELCHE